ncbi:hypothetical protein G6011_02925 [Alternaria panax]|uniref:Uncharacterized protein n=1 Tax=Alternaria panax TaxID=48097 RepID=A0AAD4F9K3_9PLEO|nr:hypothetical protein G6011_02925 [Alternaria panax]
MQNLPARELHASWRAGRFPSITHLLIDDYQDYRVYAPFREFRFCTIDVLLGEKEVTLMVNISLCLNPEERAGDEPTHCLKATAYFANDRQLRILEDNKIDRHLCIESLWETSTTGIRVVKKTKQTSKYGFDWVKPMRHGMTLTKCPEKVKDEHSETMATVVAE